MRSCVLALAGGSRATPGESSGRLLKDKLRLKKVVQPDGRVKWELLPIKSQLSFDKGFFVFVR